jgi:hypothetical protein
MHGCTIAVTVAICCVASGLADAAQRTFVATTGSDTAACSAVSPCRSFTKAMSVTDVGGEVVVLESGGYGAVVIGKSVSIIAPAGVHAAISVSSGHGITINAANVDVTLRGLAINGAAGSGSGIVFLQGKRLAIERCIITNMGDNGIDLRAPSSDVVVSDTLVRGAANSGLYADGFSGYVNVTVDASRFERNKWGVFIRQSARATVGNSSFHSNSEVGATAVWDNAAASGPTTLAIESSAFHRNLMGVTAVSKIVKTFSSDEVRVHVTRSTLAGHVGALEAEAVSGAVATISASHNTVGSNFTAIYVTGGDISLTGNTISDNSWIAQGASGTLRSHGNNALHDNAGNGVAFTPASLQ